MKDYGVGNKKLLVARSNKKYSLYQRMKNRIKILTEKLMMNEILEKVQTYLTVNFITKLSLMAEKNVILVIYDKLSKITYFVPTIEKISVEKLVRLFKDNMQKLYRLLKSVISNRKPHFVTELTKEYYSTHKQMDKQNG